MPFDLDAETSELRKQSAMTSRVARTLFVTAVVCLILFGIALFAPEPEIRENPGSLLVFGVIALAVGGGIAWKFHQQSQRLIEHGVVVKADLQSVTRLPKGWYRITVSYELNGNPHEKSLNVASLQCGAIEGAGFVLLAVHPETPSDVMPLYNYASRKQYMDVMCCKCGLV